MSPLAPDHIQVCNVRPAVAAATALGVAPAVLEALGLPAATLADPDGAVPGAATYAHMEHMHRRPDFPDFLRAAVQQHTISSLGVVGLACKTLHTVGETLACHQRFQHLTNRTARYTASVSAGRLVLQEERWGAPRPGLLLISDYTLLVAVRLLRLVTGAAVPVIAASSRHEHIPPSQRAVLEEILGAPVRTGALRASLELDAEVLSAPVTTADPELAGYFRGVLARAARSAPDESVLLSRVRLAIQESLATGTPTGAEIGRRLAMSQRTLQRRLTEQGFTFAALLADTRRRLAEGYLRDPTLSLSEVAYLLGYREEASFFRAFRRWSGTTPSQWRQTKRTAQQH